MEKLLVFGVSDAEYHTVKQLASRMKIACERFSSASYSCTLDQLLAASKTPLCAPDANTESLLVLCNLSDKRLDKVLFELRKSGTALTYKAVLTPTNRHFTVAQLFLEMRREKAAYERMQPSFNSGQIH